MDGYDNYIIINLITYCMKYAIYLFIGFPYTSHFFQLFSVNVFASLKYTLIEEINAIFKHNFKYIA